MGEADPARRSAYHAGYAQSHACAEALAGSQQQGVAQATARGSDSPLWVAAVGADPAVSEPGAVLDAFDRVVWWQMGMPALPTGYPWSRTEVAQLMDAGVQLPDPAVELERAARSWLKPILAARRQLILVTSAYAATWPMAWWSASSRSPRR